MDGDRPDLLRRITAFGLAQFIDPLGSDRIHQRPHPQDDAQRLEVGGRRDGPSLTRGRTRGAAKTFRKLRGHTGMPKLIAALRAHDAKLKPAAVDAPGKAA